MRDRQELFEWWHSTQLFNVRVSDLSEYYCEVTGWWAQYEAPVLLIVQNALVPFYYSGLVLVCFADDRTCLWTILLAECVFMAVTMFVSNTRHSAFLRHKTLNVLLNGLSEGVLSRFSDNILDAVRDVGLYKLLLDMDADTALTSLSVHRYTEIDWTKTALQGDSLHTIFRLTRSLRRRGRPYLPEGVCGAEAQRYRQLICE